MKKCDMAFAWRVLFLWAMGMCAIVSGDKALARVCKEEIERIEKDYGPSEKLEKMKDLLK